MKHYLDTNALRQLSKIPKSIHSELFTSYLVVFETISGINSEKQYKIRKSTLKKIKDNDIKVVWESPKTLTLKSINICSIDYDLCAVKKFMDIIINSNSYEELQKESITINGNLYNIDTFAKHDSNIASEAVNLLNRPQKVKIKDKLTEDDIDNLKYDIFDDFLTNAINLEKGSKQYIESATYFFDKNKSLHNYIKYLAIFIYESNNGRVAGSNDCFDIAHLIYSDGIETFISDDKFYKKIDGNYFKLKFLTLHEFIESVTITRP